MRVAIFGAQGPTGQLLTRDILDAGHDAIAITRRPDDFPLTAVARLTVVGADATSEVSVKRALYGAQAVVSTLGAAFSRRPISLNSQSASVIIEAMAESGARRLVVTSSGAVDPWIDPDWHWFERTIASRVLAAIGLAFVRNESGCFRGHGDGSRWQWPSAHVVSSVDRSCQSCREPCW